MPPPEEFSTLKRFRLRHIPEDDKIHKHYRATSYLVDSDYCDTRSIIYINFKLQRDMSKYEGCTEINPPHFFSETIYSESIKIQAQYKWMFPLHMLFFQKISIYVYGLTPARNKGTHAFPVPDPFLFT
jgi:hypothetical protein